jgi:hypothetical protein
MNGFSGVSCFALAGLRLLRNVVYSSYCIPLVSLFVKLVGPYPCATPRAHDGWKDFVQWAVAFVAIMFRSKSESFLLWYLWSWYCHMIYIQLLQDRPLL